MSSQIYKDQIPQDWEAVKLGEITEIIGGGTPDTRNSKFWEGQIPWISSSDLSENNIKNIKKSKFITKEAIEKSATKIIPENSVLVVSRVGVGKIAVSKEILCTSQDFQSLILKNDNPFFLSYLLINEIRKLKVLNQGTSIQGFTKEDLKNLEILIPKDKAEQDRIAQVLGDMDDLISAKCELLDKKRAIKQAAAQQLLTPKPHWYTTTLGGIFTFLKGKGLSKEKLNSNGKFKCILYGELYTTYNEVIDSIESSTNCEEGKKSKFDDLLIPASTTTSAIDLAKASVVLQCEILIGGDINILRKKRNDVSGKFMAYYLTSTKKIEIAQYAQGITIIHLYAKNLSELEISYPSLLEQTKIAQILSDMDEEISALQDEIEKLKMIKQGAMGELLSGKIRLKG
jgi:restriction modification system DNA specificity domain protein